MAAAKASTVCGRQSLAAEWEIAGLRMSGVDTGAAMEKMCFSSSLAVGAPLQFLPGSATTVPDHKETHPR